MKTLKEQILSNYDCAFLMDWNNPWHVKISQYLSALMVYQGTKMNGYILDQNNSSNALVAYRFNVRSLAKTYTNMFRKLFLKESPDSFKEEKCGDCCIFSI